jgi:hypothetical protein
MANIHELIEQRRERREIKKLLNEDDHYLW